jgi:hypothetical protein
MKKLVSIFLLVLAWVVIGALLNRLKIIHHPAYWALYGAVFGIASDWIIDFRSFCFNKPEQKHPA